MNNNLFISGMTCVNCAYSIEKVLNRLDGVKEAKVNFTLENLFVSFDENIVSLLEIENVIKKLGYSIKKEDLKNISISIGGMTCTACTKIIENEIKKLKGIKDIKVNFASEKASIKYDTNIISLENIEDKIVQIGYFSNKKIVEKSDQLKKLHKKLIFSAIFALPLLYIAMGHMINLYIPKIISPSNSPIFFTLTQLFLTIPILIIGRNFFKIGYKNLFRRTPNMDSLIAIGTSSAFIYSLFATFMIVFRKEYFYTNNLYFESAGVILTLILFGKYLESIAKNNTFVAIKELIELQPKIAIVKRSNEEIKIPITDVKVDDTIIIKPGSKIPTDGVVVKGHSSIDESMISGESIPVEKIGSKVVGATTNKNGTLEVKVEKIGKDTVLSQIIKLVEEAQNSKAPIARLADIISGYFVPIVISIAIISGILWYISGSPLAFALTIFVSILVIACPCALGLATPTAIMVGTGIGAKNGILIKSGEVLETIHKSDFIVFDKTGTITEGKPKITDIFNSNNYSNEEVMMYLVSGEKHSEHPLSEAILHKAKKMNIKPKEISDFSAIPGKGITFKFYDKDVFISNEKLIKEKNIYNHFNKELLLISKEGKTPIFLTIDNKLEALIAVADTLKKGSKEAIDKLHQIGLKTAIITGDNKVTAHAIAKNIGIHMVISQVLPKDKSFEIKKLQEKGHKVTMVGDGINDAPALIQADVGIAIGSGTDIAIESADIVLMKNNIDDVVTALSLSKATVRNIKQNLFWAFIYNTLGIPIAAGVLYIFGGPTLNPMIAAGAMSLSSVSVLSNALRLNLFKPYKNNTLTFQKENI